jgi:hypothetical protein
VSNLGLIRVGQPGAWQPIAARAEAYLQQSQSAWAEDAYWLAFAHAVSTHGPDHPDVQALYAQRAAAVRAQGRPRDAAAIERLGTERTPE